MTRTSITSVRNSIILGTEKIIDMDGSERRKLLLTLLGTNPNVVLRAMGVPVPGEPIPKPKLFKVVLANPGPDKINAIKAFRHVAGQGLADAKAWSEGKEIGGLPSGVMAKDIPEDDATRRLSEINSTCRMYNVPNAQLVDNDAFVQPLPWKAMA